jgi:hypothetical protein
MRPTQVIISSSLERNLLSEFTSSGAGKRAPNRNGEASHENTHSVGHFQRHCGGLQPSRPGRAAKTGSLIA